MKKSFLIFLWIIFSSLLFAQKDEQPILFKNGVLKAEKNILTGSFAKQSIQASRYDQHYYLLIQFAALPSQKLQSDLKKVGIGLEGYISGNAYLAKVDQHFNFSMAKNLSIISIQPLLAKYKIDEKLSSYTSVNDKENLPFLAVGYYSSLNKNVVEAALKKMGASIIPAKSSSSAIVFVAYDKLLVDAIASLPFVTSVNLQTWKDKPLNYNDVAAHGVSGLNAIGGKNLNGKNITLGVGDNADISSHIDFAGRLINRTPWFFNAHGTHTSATAAGAGIIDITKHGMAPKATIISQFFSDIIINAPTYVADNNLVITNNSYYSSDVGCAGEGEYDALSSTADAQQKQYMQLLHVIAAGNDGDITCSPYPAYFGTVKTGWQSAKNVLTVGAIKTQDYTNASFSSRGPVKDGRLKPEICAGGWDVNSAYDNNQYGTANGTSMAAPAVTGSLALMYERYRQLHGGSDPISALIKGIACNTAEDIGNPGPDFTFGFGMLNARRGVAAIDSNRYFIDSVANGSNVFHTINLPQAAKQLKVLLSWTDAEGVVNAPKALVNDLDLTVTEPSNVLHHPLILNPAPANVNNTAIEGVDRLNNIEQVVIDNPAAGNYSVSINGFLLPFGKQAYTLTYEIVQSAVQVEYPAGGETLVPGETENIRWDAYGTGNNGFILEYSTNGGASWSLIDSTVAATTRIYPWVVPSTVTNTALVRVSAKNTIYHDQCDFNFSVLGRPVLTATKACEGAVLLKWNSIAGATSYDILKLAKDSMQEIGNTTDTFLLVTGLNKNADYWLGVKAKNGTVSGRRSISINITPSGGACTLTAFNNDIKVDSILTPTTARNFFSNESNASLPVQIRIKNMGTVVVGGPFTVSYSIHDSLVATENVTTPIPADSAITYTFATPYPLPATYNYSFKAWTNNGVLDSNKNNDTAYKIVKRIDNAPISTLPFVEGFESMVTADFRFPEMAIGDNQRIDFSTNTSRGRARTFVNTGFAHSGTKAITLDQAPINSQPTVDSLVLNYNLSTISNKQLRFDFYYKNHGQADSAANRVWIRGSENDTWVQAYDLYANQGGLGEWAHAVININDILGNAVPPQNMSATFQVKIGQEGLTSANSPMPETDIDDGYTFDDFTLKSTVNDLTVVKINSPKISDCSLTTTEAISITIKNFSDSTLTDFQVAYQINSDPVVTEVIPVIAPGQTLDYVFNQTADLSAYADYSVKVWVKYIRDDYPDNDSILNFKIRTSPVITSYPYLEKFENSDGYFYTKGTNTTWQWGTPTKTIINKAANGNGAWVTNLTGDYSNNETSYLYSPCFDLTGLTKPVLSFSHIFDIELDYDYTWVEYSTDGINWLKLGSVGSGTTWYDGVPTNTWRTSKTKWHVASIDLPITNTVVRFRFVLSSDAGLSMEGVGVDDVHIFDKASIYTGLPLTNISQPVNGNNWINFISGGKNIVSINPNGQDLGQTSVDVYPYVGIVRNSNNQYYANRNIVIRSENKPTGNVGIRFYFTKAEADSLINAIGCSTCQKPVDAYELGITKFSGNAINENGTLNDNFSGYYNFITPDSTYIAPYDNGYYAEYSVNSFSEFWLSKGPLEPAPISTCVGNTFTFKASANGTAYQWQINTGNGYTNVVNGVNYSGATTATLQLINLPATASGNRYRCLVNTNPGNENIVRFVSIWNGATDTDWFKPSNWSCGVVPDQYTDVVIPNGLVNYPVVNNDTAVKSLRVYLNATVTIVAGKKLDIVGN